MKAHAKLALGTVQLGLRYGIRERDYKPPSPEEAAAILATAAACGLNFLDTAFEYAESEQVIGSLRPPHWQPRIITKTPKFREGGLFLKTGRWLQKAYELSCADLRVETCHALMVHNPENLLQPGGHYLIEALQALKQSGKVGKIGVSVYDRHQVVEVSQVFPFEIIQLPLSLADQRLLRDGTLRELRSRGVEIHVRSAFLQGALLLEADEVPPGMEGLNPALAELKRRSAEAGVSVIHALLGFTLDLSEVDAVVVGVNQAAQLEELGRFSQRPLPKNFDRSPLPVSDESLLNPGTWKRRINI